MIDVMEKFSNDEIEMEIGRMPETVSSASPGHSTGFWDDDSVISSMTITTSSHTRPTRG